MKILALEPYLGGSHQAFLEGWSSHSRHHWTVVGHRTSKWKWRMRHAPVTLSEEVRRLSADLADFDLLFCSDMLNLAEFKGLAGPPLSDLPSIVYFHENQLTYPVQCEDERDRHFGMTNFTTALAADAVWFNSAFHRDSFLGGLGDLLKAMPDHHCLDQIEIIRRKSQVRPQGIYPMPARGDRPPGPTRLLWAARWEFDKNPEMFFEALVALKDSGGDFCVDVIGQRFERVPEVFDQAREQLGDRIGRWGYQDKHDDYVRALLEADILVSTADHEFFGVSVVEAIAAGAFPLLPERLSYPEILRLSERPDHADFFYDGSLENLVDKLKDLVERAGKGCLWKDVAPVSSVVEEYVWPNLAPKLDSAADEAV